MDGGCLGAGPGQCAYYGVGLKPHLEIQPAGPVQMHFGLTDPSIPPSDIEALQAAHPAVEIHRYDAGHAFNRDDDVTYLPGSVLPGSTVSWFHAGR